MLVASESPQLIDASGLKGEGRQRRDRDNYDKIALDQTIEWRKAGDRQSKSKYDDEREFGRSKESGQHNRRNARGCRRAGNR